VAEEKIVEDAPGTLFVVATPIGNLEDITLRAVRILGEVDFVASEDTRHTRKLLSHLSLSKPLISYYKDKETSRAEEILLKLLGGQNGALVSDAGTPAVSDPGAILVRKCHDHNIPVIPIPGPSSLTAAISVSGFGQTSFVFLGFLPGQKGKRSKLLSAHAHDQELIIFFETAKRIKKALFDCLEIFGERKMVLAREITKLYEEVLRGSISDVIEVLSSRKEIKGECVILLDRDEGPQADDIENLADLLRWYRDNTNSSLKDAVKRVSVDLNVSRSQTYKEALSIWHEEQKLE
jgi:16S rRNA (cytidine1402-2'-O)-methyltransferase